MKKKIDGKFHIDVIPHDNLPSISIVKTSNGDPIPDDEPLILIRARDKLALPLLRYYEKLSIEDGCTPYHMNLVNERIVVFEKFAEENPRRMKQPGITEGR